MTPGDAAEVKTIAIARTPIAVVPHPFLLVSYGRGSIVDGVRRVDGPVVPQVYVIVVGHALFGQVSVAPW